MKGHQRELVALRRFGVGTINHAHRQVNASGTDGLSVSTKAVDISAQRA